MLKHAYEIGFKLAMDEYGLTPAQMSAAQNLGGLAGGVAGSAGGSLLGKSLGQRAAESFDLDEERSKLIGSILGGLGGGAVGGYAGTQIPKFLRKVIHTLHSSHAAPQEDYSQSALGLMPYGPDSNYMGLESSGYYPEY